MATYQKRFFFSGYITLKTDAEDSEQAWDKMQEMLEQGFTREQIIDFIKTLDVMEYERDVEPQLIKPDEMPERRSDVTHGRAV